MAQFVTRFSSASQKNITVYRYTTVPSSCLTIPVLVRVPYTAYNRYCMVPINRIHTVPLTKKSQTNIHKSNHFNGTNTVFGKIMSILYYTYFFFAKIPNFCSFLLSELLYDHVMLGQAQESADPLRPAHQLLSQVRPRPPHLTVLTQGTVKIFY
jgi:hypothetical protein